MHHRPVIDTRARALATEAAVILVDGPMAGHLFTIPADVVLWHVHVPSVPRIVPFTAEPPKLSPIDDDVTYWISECVYRTPDDPQVRRTCRIGSTTGSFGAAALNKYVPTGLAEQGLYPWDAVTPTVRDRAEPLEILEVGDPEKDCALTFADSWWGVAEVSCACGWRTDRLALDRRSQVVRAAHLHELDAPRRRRLLHAPIALNRRGAGPAADCLGGIAFDEAAEMLFGVCRRCGWQTERVERFRGEQLRQLCLAHTGPDGVRSARNRVRAALGAPLLPAEAERSEPAAPQNAPGHSDKFCADTSGARSTWLPVRCIGGGVYGLCGHDNCYGACEYQGDCVCSCHRAGRDAPAPGDPLDGRCTPTARPDTSQ